MTKASYGKSHHVVKAKHAIYWQRVLLSLSASESHNQHSNMGGSTKRKREREVRVLSLNLKEYFETRFLKKTSHGKPHHVVKATTRHIL